MKSVRSEQDTTSAATPPLDAILAAIDVDRAQAQREAHHFTALTRQQLNAAGNRAVIAWQSWPATVRDTLTYLLGVGNPSQASKHALFVHLYIGLLFQAPGSSEPTRLTGTIDTRFGALTLPHYPGLAIEPGRMHKLVFTLPIDNRSIGRGAYPGTAVLYSSAWHSAPVLIDSATFVFQASP